MLKKLFFSDLVLHDAINYTSISLISKVTSASHVSQFRHITYCITLYKLVSKVLTRRFQNVVGSVVNSAHVGFVLDRKLLENVSLATELIKGYIRGKMSHRCMIKVDLKKEYDSIEWSFLRDMLSSLGFLIVFINFIMKCISYMYSILVNGIPIKPFKVRKIDKETFYSYFCLQWKCNTYQGD